MEIPFYYTVYSTVQLSTSKLSYNAPQCFFSHVAIHKISFNTVYIQSYIHTQVTGLLTDMPTRKSTTTTPTGGDVCKLPSLRAVQFATCPVRDLAIRWHIHKLTSKPYILVIVTLLIRIIAKTTIAA